MRKNNYALIAMISQETSDGPGEKSQRKLTEKWWGKWLFQGGVGPLQFCILQKNNG